MFPDRRSTCCLLLLSALTAAACGDRANLSSPTGPAEASVTPTAPASSAKVKVKTFQLASNTLGIEGAPVSGNATLANSGQPIDGVSIRGQILQGSATRQAVLLPLNCAGTPATLPIGTCDLTFNASASNLADGSGTLVAGAAVLELDVIQTVSGTATVIATKSLNITLVVPLGISSLTLNATTLVIDGATVGWTATITNPGSALHGVVLQGYMIQGSTQRAAGGVQVNCGGGPGVLPTGTCTISFATSASNSNAGTGTLVPGAATFQLQLIESGSPPNVLDTENVAVTLTGSHPTITSVTVNPQNFAIDGPSTTVTVVLNNGTGAAVSGLRLSESILQTFGPANRAAGGAAVSCGAGDGVLPTGNCTMTLSASASNSAAGSGTFIAQLANLEVDLIQSAANGDVAIDSKSVSVGLLPAPKPVITNVTLGSQYVVLGGPALTYSVSLSNQNINSFTSVVVNVRLTEQNGVQFAITGGPVTNCGGTTGVLAPGTCTVSGSLSLPVSSGAALGDATIEVDLLQFAGPSISPYDSRTSPVTVTANTLSIASMQLQSTTIAIGSSTPLSVTVYNPGTTSLSTVFVQGEMIQGSADRAANGTNVVCGNAGSGVLPPGFCTFVNSAAASNSASGIGTLVAGQATFRLTLYIFDGTTTTQYDVKEVPVTLVNP